MMAFRLITLCLTCQRTLAGSTPWPEPSRSDFAQSCAWINGTCYVFRAWAPPDRYVVNGVPDELSGLLVFADATWALLQGKPLPVPDACMLEDYWPYTVSETAAKRYIAFVGPFFSWACDAVNSLKRTLPFGKNNHHIVSDLGFVAEVTFLVCCSFFFNVFNLADTELNNLPYDVPVYTHGPAKYTENTLPPDMENEDVMLLILAGTHGDLAAGHTGLNITLNKFQSAGMAGIAALADFSSFISAVGWALLLYSLWSIFTIVRRKDFTGIGAYNLAIIVLEGVIATTFRSVMMLEPHPSLAHSWSTFFLFAVAYIADSVSCGSTFLMAMLWIRMLSTLKGRSLFYLDVLSVSLGVCISIFSNYSTTRAWNVKNCPGYAELGDCINALVATREPANNLIFYLNMICAILMMLACVTFVVKVVKYAKTSNSDTLGLAAKRMFIFVLVQVFLIALSLTSKGLQAQYEEDWGVNNEGPGYVFAVGQPGFFFTTCLSVVQVYSVAPHCSTKQASSSSSSSSS